MPLRCVWAVHPSRCLYAGETLPMWKPTTGEPYAGEPHVRFGGRGGATPLPDPAVGLTGQAGNVLPVRPPCCRCGIPARMHRVGGHLSPFRRSSDKASTAASPQRSAEAGAAAARRTSRGCLRQQIRVISWNFNDFGNLMPIIEPSARRRPGELGCQISHAA